MSNAKIFLENNNELKNLKQNSRMAIISSKIPKQTKIWGRSILKLILELFIVTFLVFTIIFAITNAINGSPKIISDAIADKAPPEVITALENKLGLHDNWLSQYGQSISNIFDGTFGTSWSYNGMTTSQVVWPKMVVSIQIGLFAIGLSIAMGIPFGIFLARRKGTTINYINTITALIAFSMPSFIIALIIMTICYGLGLPIIFSYSSLYSLFIPAFAISIPIGLGYSRHLRGSIKNEYSKQYVDLARIKGASESQIFRTHVLRPSLKPIVTYLPYIVISSLFGVVATEMVFAIPGTGTALVNAALDNDRNAILCLSFFYTIIIIFSFFTKDLLLQFIDPKMRIGDK